MEQALQTLPAPSPCPLAPRVPEVSERPSLTHPSPVAERVLTCLRMSP